MYLKRLEVYGFKTFAQRTTFEFLPGVTAVVGPNGSGKSNVADAVRWVLGEQSFGNLRSKRTDDLIFGGGKGRAPMGFAEVFLTIDNSDRLLPLDFDEVTIGRRAYRDGENEYTINRSRVRLRDVIDAVSPLGSSYTLINQGLVDSALALHPEERRRLFEDAAEIGPYQAKKNEAERRLRETEANLLRLNDLVSELEPQLRMLKRQARDAEAVSSVEDELSALLRQHYAAHWSRSCAQLEQATAHERSLAAQLSAARTTRERVEQEVQAERDRLRAERQTLDQQRTELAAAQREHDAAARELAVTQERLAGIEQRVAALRQRAIEIERSRHDTQADRGRIAGALETAREELHDATQRLHAAERAFEEEFEQRRIAERDVAVQRDAVLQATTALETAKARAAQTDRRVAALQQELAEIDQVQRRATADRDHRAAVVAEAQQAVAAADEQARAAAQTLESKQNEHEKLRHERDHLDAQLNAARRTHGELQTRYDALSRLARSYEGTFAGVRAAMQWADDEGHSFKLVSSLLQVPPELETAIEVALGTRLQQIIVERWEQAEAAIAQLKRNNAGRATFLPLDTLKPASRRAVPIVPGIRGVAADLIAVDDGYAQIAAYLLGRTLVADDLQAARRALPKLEGGWTIVTLAGEQVASGGAITGGTATKESGTLRRERELRDLPAKIAASHTEVERWEHERERVQQRSNGVQHAINAALNAVRSARAARDGAQRTLETRRRELHRAEDTLQSLARRRATTEQERHNLDDQTSALAEAVQVAEATRADAQARLETAERLLEERRSALNSGEQALEPLRDARSVAASELRSLEVEARTVGQTLDRLASEQASLGSQTEQLTAEQSALREQIQHAQEAQAVAVDHLDQAKARLVATEQNLQHAEQQLVRLELAAREHTAALLDLEAAHADAALAAQRCQSERDGLWERAAEDNIDIEALDNGAPAENSEQIGADLHQRIDQLKNRLRRMGPVNALAPAEFKAAQERYAFLGEQLDDVRDATSALRAAIAELDTLMQQRFETTFDAIGQEFERSFKQLFGGGSAQLSLVRSEGGDTVQGVEIVAQPPGKRLLNLQLLSGGERSLTAAALLFAILKVNPSPFCMLDEVDAALDEANVVRFREALLDLAERTQFIIITHNRGTVEAANTLYGITMGDDGGSRVVSLRLEEVDAEGSLALVT